MSKLDLIIEHNRAVNLVLKLQRDLEILIEGKSYRGAATTARELGDALIALREIQDRNTSQAELFPRAFGVNQTLFAHA